MSFKDTPTEELEEALDQVECSYSETSAEASNEVAMFGDSWPGSSDQLSGQRNMMFRLRAELASRKPVPTAEVICPDSPF